MTVEPIHPTAVQTYVPSVASTPLPDAVSTLRAWASTYAEVAAFVAPLVDTPFCPDSYRPQVPARASAEDHQAAREVAVATATAAVIYGAAIGFDPLTALQNVYVVSGRPGLYAAAMVAIAQAAGHEIRVEEMTDSRVVVCGRRHGRGPEERVVVTMDMAQRAGWTRNAKYGSDPQSMLYARAASRLVRHIAQDALKGLGSSVEELQDGDESAVVPGVQTVARAALPGAVEAAQSNGDKPKMRTATRKRAAAGRPAGEVSPPPLPGEDDDPPPAAAVPAVAADPPTLPGETGEFATAEQFAAIAAGFRDLDIAGDARREYVSRVLGRTVANPGELTTAEAAVVIESLLGPGDDAQGVLDVEEPPDGES